MSVANKVQKMEKIEEAVDHILNLNDRMTAILMMVVVTIHYVSSEHYSPTNNEDSCIYAKSIHDTFLKLMPPEKAKYVEELTRKYARLTDLFGGLVVAVHNAAKGIDNE